MHAGNAYRQLYHLRSLSDGPHDLQEHLQGFERTLLLVLDPLSDTEQCINPG